MRKFARLHLSTACTVAAVAVTCFAGCASATDASSGDESVIGTEGSALTGYDGARGNLIANRALALWNGHPSGNLCLKGVGDSLASSGAVSPAFPRLPSAVAFDDWARANPGEMSRRGFVRMNLDANHIPRGSIITWRPGQCGYHALYGHIEIVADNASSRACSDYCGIIKKTCGAPGIYVPVGAGGGGPPPPPPPPPPGGACSVQGDGRLHCDDRAGTLMHAAPNAGSAVVNTLRTGHSWFDCWAAGERHAGGNTTWYHTLGDDNGNWGFVPGVALQTPDSFDANPSAHGLKRCGG